MATVLRRFTVLSKPELIADVRRRVGEAARECGFTEEEIHDLKLAVNEAVANIIEHAYEWRDDQPIRVNILGRPGEIEIRLRDYGKKVDEEKIQSRDLDDVRDGGIGIFLMRSLTDEVIYDTSPADGTELILIKRHQEAVASVSASERN